MNTRWMQIRVMAMTLCSAALANLAWAAPADVHVDLTITLPEGETADSVKVEFPKLKFNKRVLMSYTMDDGVAGAYCRIFTAINKKWDDTLNFCHQGVSPSTGSMFEKTLGYTDGTGIEKRFAAGVAIWPQAGNKQMANFMLKEKPPADWRDPYLKWYEIPLLLDFGFSVYEHNTATDDPKDVAKIAAGFVHCQEITRKELNGRGFKVLMEPDGNYAYCEASLLYPPIKMTCNQGRGNSRIHHPLTDEVEFEKTVIQRRFPTEKTPEEELAYCRKNHDDANPAWYHLSTHRPGQFMQDVLRMINDAFGKDGVDDIWFATCDEYYEYVFMRKHAAITVKPKGRQVSVSLTIPQGEDFYYNDLSLLVSGIKAPGRTDVSAGSNVNALSWAKAGEALLVNVGFNPLVLERAQRYTTRFEGSRLEGDREDALYFVSQLRKELQPPYRSRIETVTLRAPLIIEEMSVGKGVGKGPAWTFPISFKSNRVPTEYKALDHRDHTLEKWSSFQAGQPAELKIRSMSTNEAQTVYFIIRDEENTSEMMAKQILMSEHR
ncbi:MAG: hypothetical protein WCS65_04260 [Verrucomicrobiae bacterium]